MLCNTKGASAIETAVVLPIIVFLMLAIIFFGIFVNAQIVVNHAARLGAREYGVYGDEGRARNIIEEELAVGGLYGNSDIEMVQADETVSVAISYNQNVHDSTWFGVANSFCVQGRAVYRRDKH